MAQLHPSHWDTVYFNRGNSKSVQSDYQGSIQDYTEAIKLNPSSSHSFYNRGNSYFDLYEFGKAINDYEEVIGLYSTNAAYNRGTALLSMGKLEEARDCYRSAAEEAVDHIGIHQNLGTLERVLPLIQGLEYTWNVEPDPVTAGMCLRISIPETSADIKGEIQRFIFFGRAGGVGNTGGPGLTGGQGGAGARPFRVYAEVHC